MSNGVYYPISFDEIVISGAWGAKLIDKYVMESAYINHTSFEKSRRIFASERRIRMNGFDVVVSQKTCNLSIQAHNNLTYEYLKTEIEQSLNEYFMSLINKVPDENFKNKILNLTWNKDSLKSKFHIFNIEMLCSCAIRKPKLFNMMYELMRDKTALYENITDYEFYIFAMFDSDSEELWEEIYDYMINRGEEIRNCHDSEYRRRRPNGYNLKNEILQTLDDESKEKIDKNLSKLLLIIK